MPKPKTPQGWNPRMENLEDRLAMSANPLVPGLGELETHSAIQDEPPQLSHHVQSAPDFWLDGSHSGVFADHDDQIERTLQEAHNQTGLLNVRNDYGFTGGGQTVAVIDSGIAWDHFALGGGLGSNYRVVGGWDFTENDADPYDDGPEGSHGTHVAGIVGGDSGVDNGVAPDVDLVGLRVFDDAGNGYFSWVEDALQWVHDNRNAFENPITAVNLSLGAVGWNSESIPAWANLENEFAQLEADGIFISVSAGNSFADYNTTGLSYPAASPYVVPVMSVDDSGSLSYFSQRSTRAIAAPGRWITSTVPDYVGNNNGITDDYATFSGTSMAAPYVAGASVIIREAMEFVGYTNITQDTIFDHMKATAESFYDSATGEWFDRLDLDAAIDALMPTDDFGSTMGSAFDLGTLSSTASTNGVIGTLSDADYFTFTAGSSGTVTITANTTHDLNASWDSSATGWSSPDGTTYTLDVVAGNTYTVGLSTSDGLGYYGLDLAIESTFSYTDWGTLPAQQTQSGLSISGSEWYRVQAGMTGYLTVDAVAGGSNISFGIYDTNLELIQGGGTADRVDVQATAGQAFYIRVDGAGTGVDLRLTNALKVVGDTATVSGTTGDDSFVFAAGSTQHIASLNGVQYTLDAGAVTAINFNGGGGSDTATLTGSSANESAVLRQGSGALTASGYSVSAHSVEFVTVNGGGGQDTAYLYDAVGDDLLVTTGSTQTISGTGYSNTAVGFSRSFAFSSLGGNDRADHYDEATDDRFVGTPTYSVMYSLNGDFYNYAGGFSSTYAYSVNGGADMAQLNDGTTNDTLTAAPDVVTMTADDASYYNEAQGFGSVVAIASSGEDRANFSDGAGNDQFIATPSYSLMLDTGGGYWNYAIGFDQSNATSAAGGIDLAGLYDSSGNDLFEATPASAQMRDAGNTYQNTAAGFSRVLAVANAGGSDQAVLYDGATDDEFIGTPTYSILRSTTGEFESFTIGFDSVYAMATGGGNDNSYLYDSAGRDQFFGAVGYSYLMGLDSGHLTHATGFDRVYAYGGSGGADEAFLNDTSQDDVVYGRSDYAFLTSSSAFYFAKGFDTVTADSQNGGNDSSDVVAVDYVFNEIGAWA